MVWHGPLSLRVGTRKFLRAFPEHRIARGIAGWSLSGWMQGFKKRYERRCLRRTQILSVCWHVTAALDHLANQLILGEPHRDAVQGWPSLAAGASQGMAVAALLGLEDERALSLERAGMTQQFFRNWIAAPRVHVRTPGCRLREMGKCSKRDRDQQHGQNCNGTSFPALLSFPGQKGKKQQSKNHHNRPD